MHFSYNRSPSDAEQCDAEQREAELLEEFKGLRAEIQAMVRDRVLDVSSCEVMRPLLPSAEFDIMDDTGHLPMLERPKLCAQRYRGFLRRRAQG